MTQSSLSSPRLIGVAAAIAALGLFLSLDFLIRHSTAAWYTEEYPLDLEMISEALAYFGLLLAGGLLLRQRKAGVAVLAIAVLSWIYAAVQKVGFIYVIQKQVAKFNVDGAIQWKLILDEALIRGITAVLLLSALIWLSRQVLSRPA